MLVTEYTEYDVGPGAYGVAIAADGAVWTSLTGRGELARVGPDLTFITGPGFARVQSYGLQVCGRRPVNLRTNRARSLVGWRTFAR